MSKPNRLNSRGSGHEGPHRTMWERSVSRHRTFPIGVNVMGEGPAVRPQEVLLKANRALAEPRNDPRFKDIGTSHPANSGVFPDTPKKPPKNKKGK